MSNEERRNSVRQEYSDFWTKVSVSYDKDSEICQESGHLISVLLENLSPTGACFTSEDPFELDQLVHFHGIDIINKVGKVVWTCRNKIECKTGVHFEQT